ncbi:MAG: 4-hydroxy-3-methylbut-2-enyl diphosphate reductase [Candidatus Moranbacteria bacterium GW2011_GWE1_49_15]|nr:MAG: 4-hydroxy-3-methylbut-2-enyl diphosphate reductase [Candidatus Moranbacteria bacterium GW2011_GWE2_47_10]KKW07615.1 MAG: 4-hydroxy-3-methylbut-2-enyl diphosphate reductase [Candidatus Moranbacteria bacterium GW2011_GWE1_49_15]HBP01051.1 4-hydroxy-3-methylbut-2-enyl diphosphate reductase [Candidatus Moranbacteria bacterium]
MEITLSQYAGFCEGVGRAYDMVEKIAKDPKVKRPIAVLGSLVHNNDVVKRIEKLGVLKVEMEGTLEETLDKVKGKVKTLVITAHGMGPRIYELARKNGFDLVDTTCPRVFKVQRLAKLFFDKMSQIVIIGERDHKEVKGINEWAQRKAVFVENEQELENIELDAKRNIVVLSQTTQDQEFVEHASNVIKEKYPKVEVFDSICLTTHHRQTEVKQLARENDVMVVIGAPESANSNRLHEISERVNEETYFIERADQLKEEWFSSCEKVGISAGASTPSWVIDEVIAEIKGMGERESVLHTSSGCESSL